MAGIGNYIHYHRKRYQDFGIGRYEKSGLSLDAALAINKENLKSMVNSQNISKDSCKKLAEYYTDFYYNDDKLNQKITIKDGNDVLELTLSELIAEVTKQYSFSSHAKYLDGSLVKTELQKALSKLANTVKNSSKKGAYITRGTFERYWYSIDEMVKNADKAFERNQGIGSFQALFQNKEQLQKTVNSLKEEFSQIKSQLPKMKKEDALKSKNRIKLSDSSFNNSLQNLINEYENLIIWYQGSFGGSMAGDTHEIASALSQVIETMGTNLTSLTVDDIYKLLMQDFVSGKTGAKKSANVNGIDISLLVSMEQNKVDKNGKEIYEIKNVNTDAGTFSIEYKSASDNLTPFGTIDISLNPLGDKILEEKMGINKANASLKNYSDISQSYGGHTGVNIVSGVKMEMILGMMNADFINHYLNLLGCYPSDFSSKDFTDANRQFLWAGAIRGLIGDRIEKTNDILLINNKQEKKVYVIPTYFLKEEQEFEKYIDVKYNPKIEQYNKWNLWVPAPEGSEKSANEQKADVRIANFINDIHAYKMIVSLNYAGIQKF